MYNFLMKLLTILAVLGVTSTQSLTTKEEHNYINWCCRKLKG